MGSLASPSVRLARVTESIHRISDQASLDALTAELLSGTETRTLGFINAHGVNLAWDSDKVSDLFEGLDTLLRDGKGMEILDRKCDLDPGLNMNGTDYIPALLSKAVGEPLAVFGTKDPWLGQACDKLKKQGHNIVSTLDGFQPDQAYVDAAKASKPRVILLAMGMPRQEDVANQIRRNLPDQNILLICGGAIVDFLAERFDRAPVWVQRLGMEWAFRLLKEPRRLFRRYVIGNVLFLMRTRSIATAHASAFKQKERV